MAGWDGRGSWLTFDPLITGGVQALASNVGTVQPSGGLGRTRQSGPLTMRSITPPLRWSRLSAERAPPSTGKNPVVSASTSAHTPFRPGRISPSTRHTLHQTGTIHSHPP